MYKKHIRGVLMGIKYYKNNNKIGFKSEKIKVEFSNPHIQAHDDYAFCKSEKSIMYYYYNVRIKAKVYRKWERIVDIYTHDFPEILALKHYIELFLNNQIEDEKYQKDIDIHNNLWKTYSLDTGFFSDDYYGIIQTLRYDEEKVYETFSLKVGKSLDYSTHDVIGATFNHLKREDLEEIYKCVCDFIQYSLDKHNENVKEYNKNSINSWKIEDGKLYEMDGNNVKSVFIKGDAIDEIIVLKGDIESEEFCSTEFHKFVIDDIEDDCIVFSKGYEDIRSRDYRRIEETERVSIKDLISVFEEEPTDKLNYGEEEIRNDFILILSEKEKEEFISQSIDYLFEKWKSALIDRTWMCRTEHNLPNRVKDNGNHENVYASIRVIIEELKKGFIAEVEI